VSTIGTNLRVHIQLVKEKTMSGIDERFVKLIEAKTTASRRFKELEEATSIPAVSWRKAFNAGQRPTSEMLEVMARMWPEHAFWLITGATDNEFSHTSPNSELQLDVPQQSRPAGAEFLKLRVDLSGLAIGEQPGLVDRFEDWLTEHQEKGVKRWPWLYSVHPLLAARKQKKETLSVDQAQLLETAVGRLHLARSKRIAEFKAINDDQGG